jgi:hypothetical protein
MEGKPSFLDLKSCTVRGRLLHAKPEGALAAPGHLRLRHHASRRAMDCFAIIRSIAAYIQRLTSIDRNARDKTRPVD